MKQEMRKLNRAKYAGSAEEMARLAAQGYVPVGPDAADQPDASFGRKDKQKAPPKAASGKKDKKTEQSATMPDQEAGSAEQTAESTEQPVTVPDQEAAMPEQPAADPGQAVTDGGGNGT